MMVLCVGSVLVSSEVATRMPDLTTPVLHKGWRANVLRGFFAFVDTCNPLLQIFDSFV